MRTDNIIETTNHFRCIDLIIDRAKERITESLIKELHAILKSGTSNSRKEWFAVGEYKRLPNEVGGNETAAPENVRREMKALLAEFKECLANGIVSFIITDDLKMFYYRDLQRWPEVKEYLTDTCLNAQDNDKAILDYFKIKY